MFSNLPPDAPKTKCGTTWETGEKRSLHSRILNEDQPYWVSLPASYQLEGRRIDPRYPVLYLLDGDGHLQWASGVVQFTSAGNNGNLQIPEMIVVAIPNANRGRDLTPSRSTNPMFSTSGGGDAFLQFIREELMSQIEKEYRAAPFRVLFGHSLGGLLALYPLIEQPAMFQGYIAVDSSLFFENQFLLQRARQILAINCPAPGAVYLSLARLAPPRARATARPSRPCEHRPPCLTRHTKTSAPFWRAMLQPSSASQRNASSARTMARCLC